MTYSDSHLTRVKSHAQGERNFAGADGLPEPELRNNAHVTIDFCVAPLNDLESISFESLKKLPTGPGYRHEHGVGDNSHLCALLAGHS